MNRFRAAIFSAAILAIPFPAVADSTWNKIEVIKAAAIEIRGVQKMNGNLKALAEIDQCYSRVLRPSFKYNQDVEACLAKDFTIASITAAFYSQLSPEGQKANNLDPKRTLDEMRRRLSATFLFFGIPVNEAAAFGKLLSESALQAIQAVEEKK